MSPSERVYWFDRRAASPLPPLRGETTADAVVVGGGIAGLSAARRLSEQGARVVLLEAEICGRGATGHSSGFVTPDSELQLADLARRFGDDRAIALYGAVRSVCADIRDTAVRSGLDCDLLDADSVYASADSPAPIREEYETRVRLGLDATLLEGAAVRSAIASDTFPVAVRYGQTFGIDASAFATGLRDVLRAGGVVVHEGSPAISVRPGEVRTREGVVRAGIVMVCVDHAAHTLGLARRSVYRTPAHLMVTEPLPAALLERLFPSGPVMLWDTDLVYQYVRPTGGGRLLVGGGSLRDAYAAHPGPSEPVHAALADYLHRILPELPRVAFTHRWHGWIGVTKDILPLAGPVPDQPGVFCALASAGLPWAALAGRVAADCALGHRPRERALLDPARAFTTIDPLQPVLGKRLTWMLAYLLTRNLERGGPEQVARRQRALVAGLAAAGGLGVALALRYGSRRYGSRRYGSRR